MLFKECEDCKLNKMCRYAHLEQLYEAKVDPETGEWMCRPLPDDMLKCNYYQKFLNQNQNQVDKDSNIKFVVRTDHDGIAEDGEDTIVRLDLFIPDEVYNEIKEALCNAWETTKIDRESPVDMIVYPKFDKDQPYIYSSLEWMSYDNTYDYFILKIKPFSSY